MIRKIAGMGIAMLLWASAASADAIQESTDTYGPFGTLHIYKPSDNPSHVVLFISGDGGWNLGVVDMAKSLAGLDSMVVGIDITHYIQEINNSSEKCTYGAAQFEGLSQYLQKKLGYSHYMPPVLVGYSSGATMVYATLAQSPPNTFAGGISLGFCPDLKTVHPFCKGSGTLGASTDPKLGYVYQTVDNLPSPWAVLQGDQDQVCSTPDTKVFVGKTGNGQLIELPSVGHGFSAQKNWMPQFKDAFQKIVGAQHASSEIPPSITEMSDLPLVELPVKGDSSTMAVVISGDGGWAGIDKQIGETLNKDGIPVVGLNSLQYFWSKKSPDISGSDLTRILTYYGKTWNVQRFILVGYSQGADTLPFMVARLPEDLKAKVDTVALLGLEEDVNFEFHLADWLSSNADGEYKVIPEVQKLKGMNVVCIYGADEADSACKKLDKTLVNVLELPGGHHFGGDYQALASIILNHGKT
ncbi:MAG TPA: AcvB/VirJ family lysyl-phosphatidylglycerol hydrolase [Aestuariivirga sp.]|nr:AcvB/VirJ family lysyl-phosphatidylglycerol hydrolase [Aestuariivirga sp.]